ncbi:MAG: hypothetical protein HW400_602 [Candidatus Levybacteria bacterium]|nr:hypothetical protein [Candidatus Levybacteria bacterium]
MAEPTASEDVPTMTLENKLKDVKTLKGGRDLSGKEKADTEHNFNRNFYLGELGWNLRENMVGGSKDHYLYDEKGERIRNPTTGDPVKFSGGLDLEKKLEEEYGKNSKDLYEDKARNETELQTKLRKARHFISGDKLTPGEEAIFKKDYYFEKLKERGYGFKITNGIGAFINDQKDVVITKPDGTKLNLKEAKGKSTLKINWMNGIPSKDLLNALEKEFVTPPEDNKKPAANSPTPDEVAKRAAEDAIKAKAEADAEAKIRADAEEKARADAERKVAEEAIKAVKAAADEAKRKEDVSSKPAKEAEPEKSDAPSKEKQEKSYRQSIDWVKSVLEDPWTTKFYSESPGRSSEVDQILVHSGLSPEEIKEMSNVEAWEKVKEIIDENKPKASAVEVIDATGEKIIFGQEGYRITDAEANKTYIEKGGWKLHVATQPQNYKEIDEWLFKNHKGQYKLLSGGEHEDGADFTIYIGDKARTDAFARKIEQEISPLLGEPLRGESTDRIFSAHTSGRFDIQATPLGGKLGIRYYGLNGIPADEQAIAAIMGNLKSIDGDSGPEVVGKDAQLKRVEQILEREYGEYFTGPAAMSKQPEKETLQEAVRAEVVKAMPTLRGNMEASMAFIKAIRNPSLYAPWGDVGRPGEKPRPFLKSNLGFRVEGNAEKGWFDAQSFVESAQNRYSLPLAIFMRDNHARLIVKGPYNAPEGGKKIMVYDPMETGFSEIKLNEDKNLMEIAENKLSVELRKDPQYDLRDVFKGQDLAEVSKLLIDLKAFNYQKDLVNCVPYSMFVGAMLNGLDPRRTEFKERGIERFKEDFGIKILTREEITGEAIPSRIKVAGGDANPMPVQQKPTVETEQLEASVSAANNAEKLDEVEQWAKKVKSAAVYNLYVGKGYQAVGDETTIEILHDVRNNDRRLTSDPEKRNCTIMSVVPLASSYINKKLPLEVNSQDMAIYLSYYVKKIDELGRSGNLGALAIMSNNDALAFTEAVRVNPQLVYSLVRKLNGGPIQMNRDAKINFGTNVRILPSYSGNIFDRPPDIESSPFPAGYNPNPKNVVEASAEMPKQPNPSSLAEKLESVVSTDASLSVGEAAPKVSNNEPGIVGKPAPEPYTEAMGLKKMLEATQRAKRLREGTATEEDKEYAPVIRANRTPEEVENDEVISFFQAVQKEKRRGMGLNY